MDGKGRSYQNKVRPGPPPQFDDHNRQLSATLEHHGQAGGDFTVGDFTAIAAMDPGATYRVTWNGRPIDYYERYPGVLEMTLDSHPNRQLAIVLAT